MLKLILKEEEEPKVKAEPTPVEVPSGGEVEEIDEKIAATACEEAVNSLMQQAWDFISNINSVIATLELNYKEAAKKDVIEILNALITDSTINIGMLQKAINLMNIEKIDLLDAGEDKAEKVLTKE